MPRPAWVNGTAQPSSAEQGWGTAALWKRPSTPPPTAPAWATASAPSAAQVAADSEQVAETEKQSLEWEGRTWWDMEDELDELSETEWAEAEALLEVQRQAEQSSLQRQRKGPPSIQHHWDIEDRE